MEKLKMMRKKREKTELQSGSRVGNSENIVEIEENLLIH
jgi:hypothetical protein